MNRLSHLAYIGAIVLLSAGLSLPHLKQSNATSPSSQVYFNRDKELNRELIRQIMAAEQYVYFAVYTFTRADVKDALLGAHARGLEVKGVTDGKQAQSLASQKKIINELRDAGIPVVTQDHLGIMHLKILVTDKAFASGSYNWTASATTLNDEVLEIGYDEKEHQTYKDIFLRLYKTYGGE